ncbi:GNAT family N-acetyltransferase [Legionella sp.]|uniref:GNAT family N-acetyltransferase n=1 Tax=Legionella sp. TaxID=459 RepID=UPI0032200B1B
MSSLNVGFSFRKVDKSDYNLVYDWLKKDHVKPYFYDEGLANTLNNLRLFVNGKNHNGRYSFEHWIAFFQNQPFAFLMTSRIDGPYDAQDDYDKWYEEGKETISLDLLIGEEAFLGKGLAAKMIRAFLLEQFSFADKIIIDPAEENARAVHVYEKAGFKKIERFFPAMDPIPHWMMILDMQTLLKEASK